MQVWKEVVIDLWQFLLAELFGIRQQKNTKSEQTLAELIESITESNTAALETNSDQSLLLPAAKVDAEVLAIDEVVYVVYPDTPCYLRPALVMDTVIGTFQYAEPLRVVGEREEWIHVKSEVLEGWTERSHLTKHKANVLPEFSPGTLYDADHPETLKLRTYIDDEFSAGLLRRPLLNCEYVWYQLRLKNQAFSWPPIRPRSPGRWQEILRTEPSVLVSDVPLTGCVMEYTDENGIAQLLSVNSVTPDGSLHVHGLTGVNDGLFEERVLKKTEWASYKPKFLVKK